MPFPLIAIPAIAAAASSIYNSYSQNRANNQNLQAVRETNAQNMKIYKDSLEYNRPVQQMSRLKEAGLNPMLMYGQGNVGNAANLPQMQPARVNPVQFDSSIISQLPTIKAQLDVANAQRDSLYANTAKTQEDTKRIEIENLYRAKEHELELLNKGIKAGFSQQQIKQSQAQVRLLDQQINKLTIQNKYEDERQTLDLNNKQLAIKNFRNIIANSAMLPSYTKKLIQGVDLKNQGQELENHWNRMSREERHKIMIWTMDQLQKKYQLTDAQIEKIREETNFIETKNFWYNFNALWNKFFGALHSFGLRK